MDRISVWVRTAVLSCSRPGEFGGGRASVEAALRCFFAPRPRAGETAHLGVVFRCYPAVNRA